MRKWIADEFREYRKWAKSFSDTWAEAPVSARALFLILLCPPYGMFVWAAWQFFAGSVIAALVWYLVATGWIWGVGKFANSAVGRDGE